MLLAAAAAGTAIFAVAAVQLIDGRGIAARSGEGGVVEASRVDDCATRDDSSYGKTALGQWLRGLLLDVGMPREPGVVGDDVTDTGTALEVSVYGGHPTAYVAASRPPDPELAPKGAEVVGEEGAFLVYYREGPAWKSFTALSAEWQLSLLLFPGAGHSSVSWEKGDRAVAEWFERAIARAGEDPPPCS